MHNDYRPDSIYVRRNTRKALSYIWMEPPETIDGLCDKIISDWLKQHHPKIIEHLENQKETDDQFREIYKQKPPF